MFNQKVTILRFFYSKDRLLGKGHFDTIQHRNNVSRKRIVQSEMKVHSQAYRRLICTKIQEKIS